MPARSERLYLCPEQDGEPCRVVRFPHWWDRPRFFDRFRNREVDTGHPAYVDLGFLLTPGEALTLHDESRAAYLQAHPDAGHELLARMDELREALGRSSWVVVGSYEWESGLE